MKGLKLHFQSPVHVGSPGWGKEEVETVLHSDSLFSALMHASLGLSGSPVGDVLISSAYPFIEDVLYFPRPLVLPVNLALRPDQDVDRDSDLRALSHAPLIEKESFVRWISGEAVDVDRVMRFESLRQGDEPYKRHVSTRLRARVALDRRNSASALYYFGATYYAKGSGLFCLIDATEEECQLLLGLFEFLGNEGIGGQRSSGYGRFAVEPFEWTPPSIAVPASYVSLGLISPCPGDESALKAYRLVDRGGWIESAHGPTGLRRRRAAMTLEGSILDRRIGGRIVDVTPAAWPGHRVLRYGRAFLLDAAIPV